MSHSLLYLITMRFVLQKGTPLSLKATGNKALLVKFLKWFIINSFDIFKSKSPDREENMQMNSVNLLKRISENIV